MNGQTIGLDILALQETVNDLLFGYGSIAVPVLNVTTKRFVKLKLFDVFSQIRRKINQLNWQSGAVWRQTKFVWRQNDEDDDDCNLTPSGITPSRLSESAIIPHWFRSVFMDFNLPRRIDWFWFAIINYIILVMGEEIVSKSAM